MGIDKIIDYRFLRTRELTQIKYMLHELMLRSVGQSPETYQNPEGSVGSGIVGETLGIG